MIIERDDRSKERGGVVGWKGRFEGERENRKKVIRGGGGARRNCVSLTASQFTGELAMEIATTTAELAAAAAPFSRYLQLLALGWRRSLRHTRCSSRA